MTNGFRRRRKAQNREERAASRSRFGLLWVILGVVVLVAVVGYDRYGIQQAQQRIEQARAYERNGLYAEALKEYKSAFANKRLGRRPKAEVAIAIGDIYFDHFENYDMAHNFYARAKQNAPKLFDKEGAQQRLRVAQQRSAAGGITTDDSGSVLDGVQSVQVMAAPQEDLSGPVVARYEGGEIRAGELLRLLKNSPEYNDAAFREDPARLEQFLQRHLNRTVKYQAGLDAGLHRDTDIQARLYDYQRTLISERYAVQERQRSQRISQDEVRQYYEDNKSQYVRPASATIALIKTDTQEAAGQALKQIRGGASFSDVATSVSVHQDSARRGGLIGQITEGQDEIPGVGPDRELVEALIGMRSNNVTGVTPSNGAYFIFRVVFSSPAQIITIDEARPRIEQILRGRQLDAATGGLDQRLNEHYQPELVQEGVRQFWQFALSGDTTTTPTATLEEGTTAAVTTDTATTQTTSMEEAS